MNNKNSGVLLQSQLNPKDWKMVTLGEVCAMNAGGTPDTKTSVYYGGDIPWVSIGDITNSGKELSTVSQTLSNLGLENSSAKLYPQNTLLFAMYASIGKCCIARESVSSSQAILGLYDLKGITLDFLYYLLCSKQAEFISQGQTGTQSNLSKEIVSRLEIPLPPLPIQRRIASSLSAIDDQIEALRRLIAKQEAIKKATLKLLLTPKKGWQTYEFSEIFTHYQSKEFQIQAKEYLSGGRYPIVDQGKKTIVGYSNDSNRVFKCPNGGVIIFGDHTREIKYLTFDFVIGADGTQLLGCNTGFSVNYMFHHLCNMQIPNTGYNRHFKYLKEAKYTIPPLPVQKQIAESLTSIDEHLEALEAKLKKVESLKAGMMRYFFG